MAHEHVVHEHSGDTTVAIVEGMDEDEIVVELGENWQDGRVFCG